MALREGMYSDHDPATTWTDISPPLDLPFNALALDGSGIATAIYAGNRLRRAALRRRRRELERARRYPFSGSAGVRPGVPEWRTRAATFGRGMFSFVKPTGPAIAVGLEDGLAFGTVCVGSTHFLTIEVSNVGAADLIISSVQRLMGSTDFTVLANPATPLSLAPGENIDFTVAFTPTGLTPEHRNDSDHHERPERSVRRPRGDSHSANSRDRNCDRKFQQLRKRLSRLIRRRIAYDQQSRDLSAPHPQYHRVPGLSRAERAFLPPACRPRQIRSMWSSAFSLQCLRPEAGAITIPATTRRGRMWSLSPASSGSQGEPDHRDSGKLRRRLRRLLRRRTADRHQQRQVHALHYRDLIQLRPISSRRKCCPTRSRSDRATLCPCRSGSAHELWRQGRDDHSHERRSC